MRNLRVAMMLLLALAVLALPAAALAENTKEKENPKQDASAAEKRAKLDGIAKSTMERLFSESEEAKNLYERSYGFAVFDNSKVSLGLSGAGGSGVARPRQGGQ